MFHHSISYIIFTLITQLPYAFQPWLHGYKSHPFHQLCDRKNPSFCRMMAPVARRWGNSADASFSPSRTRMPPPVAPPTTCRWSKRFQSKNGWPSNIGPRHLDQSKPKSSCFFLHVIQLLMDCVWRSWQDSAVEPPKAPWKQGGLVGERPTMPRYQDWTKCASRLQVGSVKSQERDPSKGSIAMMANPFLGPFWCDEQMIWCSSEWVLHAKISLECAKLWAKPIIKGCLQKSLHAIGFFSAMVMYHKSMEFLMTNETSRLRGGLNESQIIAPMATIHVIANGCSIPSKPFPPTIQIPDESLVKV